MTLRRSKLQLRAENDWERKSARVTPLTLVIERFRDYNVNPKAHLISEIQSFQFPCKVLCKLKSFKIPSDVAMLETATLRKKRSRIEE